MVRRSQPRLAAGMLPLGAAALLAMAPAGPAGPVTPVVAAAPQVLNLHHVSNRDGLPQTQVLDIVQDTTGYIWVGTYGGLSRFDGHEVKTLTRSDGLPSNTVNTLALDPAGRLAVGTGDGACLLDGGRLECLGVEEGLPGPEVLDIHFDEDGRAWLSTRQGLAWVGPEWTAVGGVFDASDGLPSPWVRQVIRDADGALWAATAAGVARLEAGRFVPVQTGLDDPRFLALFEGRVVIGGPDGAVARQREDWARLPLPPRERGYRFATASTDSDGSLWLAGPGVLVGWDGRAVRIVDEENGLDPGAIHSLLVDREANVWMGTNRGLTRWTRGAFTAFTDNDGLPSPFVRALHEDEDGTLWVGTRAGLAVWQGDGFATVAGPGTLPDDRIYALTRVGDELLIGTRGGLGVWHNGLRRWIGAEQGLPVAYVRAVLPHPGGGAWVATRGGALVHYRNGAVRPLPDHHPLAGMVVDAMAYAEDGHLWLAPPEGGLLVWDGVNLRSFGEGDGLPQDPIWHIAPDPAGGVWVATNGSGAYHVTHESLRQLSTRQGLANDFVWQVVPARDGSVWMYTNQGLDRFDGTRVTHFGTDDGLIDLEGAATAGLETRDGSLWFGTGAGIMRYTPASDRIIHLPPRVAIDGVVAEGSGSIEDGAELPYHGPVITVDFEALSYARPSALQYRYRLVRNGSVPSWSAPTDALQMRFARLPAGRYEFQVMAVTDEGVMSERPATFRFRVLPPFWQTWWFRAISALLFLGGGVLILRWRTHRLETERKRLREEVERHTEELRARNADLVRARDAAEAAKRAKSEFLASMSHEIRTPMNGVLGMAQILMGSELTVEQRDHVQTIISSGGSLLGILNDILDFSKIEAGKLTIEPIPFDLLVCCQDVAALLATRAEEKDVEVVLRYAPGTPRHVVGDPGRIRQILTNLTGNAVKFTERGHVLIEVEALETTESDAYIQVSVEDTGIGMDPEALAKLFQPFQQADASTTRRFGGTGLGLAISKQLVELMDGDISVESEAGVGSTFRFRLRLPLAQRAPRAFAESPAVLEGARALVVDDVDVNRRVLGEALLEWGMRPAVAESGEDALRVLRSAAREGDPFPLAILDYHMPGMDGIDLAKAIKGDPEIAGVTLVLLTSSAVRGDDQGTLGAGFSGYLVKPARMDVIRDMLVTLLTDRIEGHERSELVTRYTVAEERAAAEEREAAEERARAGEQAAAAGEVAPVGGQAAPEPDGGVDADGPARTPPAPVSEDAPALDGVRVLVAEDNRVNQLVVGKMLEKLGCEVDMAANGAEAVETYQAGRYDIVLMDCQMPEMDGFEATARIREIEAQEGRPATPVVAVTANAMKGDRERCLAAGMDDYLDKPIQQPKLLEKVRRWASPTVPSSVPT